MSSNNSDGSLIIDTELDNTGFEKGSDKLRSAMDSLGDSVNQAGENMKNAFTSGANSANSAIDTLRENGYSLSAPFEKLGGILSGALYVSMNKVAIAGKAIHTVLSGAATIFGNIGSKVKDVASKMLNFGNNTNSAADTVKRLTGALTSFRTLLVQKVKNSFISLITQDIQTAMKAFSRYSSSFNTAMSRIQTYGSQVAGNIGTLFANLITYLEPIVSRVLQITNTLVVAAGKLFAAFTGKSTVSVAKAADKDYSGQKAEAKAKAQELAKKQYAEQEKAAREQYEAEAKAARKKYQEETKAAREQYEAEKSAARKQYEAEEKAAKEAQKAAEKEAKEAQKAADAEAKQKNKEAKEAAKKEAQEYAKAAKDAAKAEKEAAKEQKEWNAELYGFDELNRQAKQDIDDIADSMANSSNTGYDPSDYVETQAEQIQMPDPWQDWPDFEWPDFEDWPDYEDYEKWQEWPEWEGVGDESPFTWVEEVIENVQDLGNLKQLGYDLAEKLANALDSIPWDKIKKAAYNIGEKLADFLNGVFSNLHLADSLGKTIAEALNTALQFALGFLRNFDFSQFGKWLGTMWNSFIKAFDFDALAEVISRGGNGVFDALNAFLSTTAETARQLGVGLGKLFNSIFVGIDFTKLANVILLGVHNLNEILKGLNETIQWDAAAKNVINGINTLIKGMVMDSNGNLHNVWTENGRQVGILIGGFVSSVCQIINGVDWRGIGTGIAMWFNNALSGINPQDLAGIISGYINGVFNVIYGFITTLDWNSLATFISTAVNSLIHNVQWVQIGQTIGTFFKNALGALSRAVHEIDWFALGQNLGNALEQIDWLGIFTQLADIIFTIFTGVVGGLFSSDGGRVFLALVAAVAGLKLAIGIGGQVVTLACEELAKLVAIKLGLIAPAVDGATPAIGGAIKRLADRFVFDMTNFRVNGHTILTGTAATFATAALAIGDAVLLAYDVKSLTSAAQTYNEAQKTHNRETETALNSFKQLYLEKGPEIAAEWAKTCYQIDTTGMSLDQAQQALVQQIDHYWDDTPQNMFEGFQQGWNSYFGAGGKGLFGLLKDAFTGAIDGILNLLGIHSPSTVFEGIGKDMIAGLLNGIKEIWNSVTSFFTTSFNALKTTFSNGWNAIKSAAGSAWDGIKSTISTKWQNVSSFVSTGWSNLKSTLGKVEWKSIGSNLVSNIKNGASSLWGGMTGTISNNWNSLKSKLSGVKFDTIGSNMVNNIKSGITSLWNGMTNTVSTNWNGIKTKLAGVKFDTIGSNLVNTLQSGFTSVWGKFSGAVSQAWDNIHKYFGSIKWDSIGANLVSGLSNGISGAWQSLTTLVTNCANGLVAKIKGAFGVHSPSTVFAEIGRYLDAGLEKGIMDGQRGLLGTATQVAAAVTNGMTPDSPDMEMSADSVVTGMQTVISGLSDIAVMFKTIADTLATVGGFRMPQIAEGSVVPYRTRVDDRTPSEDDSEAMAGYLTSILTELQAIVKNAQNGGSGRTIVLPVSMNGREVFQIVVDENNNAIRQLGSSPLKMR